ncbi:MAG TPA: hypothetical protein VE262_02655 [Blastocatellia bacterium]|nr:hypothetical protein [Blastocatellia bacterium]
MITADDKWSGVPGIIGYGGDDRTGSTGTDSQTILDDGSAVADVNANKANPNTFATGGAAEFHITNPVVALTGSGTAGAPQVAININTTGRTGINVSYNLRDIGGSTDDAVQAAALQSPFSGQAVTMSGIVTGVKSNGFFIQTPDAEADADPNTSEGILVFTSSALPAAAIGNDVTVMGNVSEFIPGANPGSPPLTEVTSPTVSVTSTGNPLPAAIALTPTLNDINDPAGGNRVRHKCRADGVPRQLHSGSTDGRSRRAHHFRRRSQRLPVQRWVRRFDRDYTFAASGTPTRGAGGPGLSNVLMTFTRVSGGGVIPAPVLMDGGGEWSQAGFENGLTYRVTPSKKRFSFAPTSLDFSAASSSLNFAGTKNSDTTGSSVLPPATFIWRIATRRDSLICYSPTDCRETFPYPETGMEMA